MSDGFLIILVLAVLGKVNAHSTSNPISISSSTTLDSNTTATPIRNLTDTAMDSDSNDGWEYENKTVVDTRRILYSQKVACGKRPYMVYLQLTKESAKAHKYKGWLCGGVIVDQWYVLTSAACVEDADKFYIVSGTTKYVDSSEYKSDECVCKNRRKVVWKCIPKNYKFDFQDSIKWSTNDIAIVKVDKPFKFGVTERGCEFATDLICYNNISRELEKAGTKGFIAGWGSGNNFREGVYRTSDDSPVPKNAKYLQEARVCIMDNEQCAKKWAAKFRDIITQYMICTKDVMKRLSELCDKRYANCTDVASRRDVEIEDWDESVNRIDVDTGRHLRNPDDYTARRALKLGGFCENDHGGPLIVKYQGKERVIGIISACKIDPKSHNCHGPFLYTSVFKNRQFLSCSIHKETAESCRRVFRTGITHEEFNVDWDVNEEVDDSEVAVRAEDIKTTLEPVYPLLSLHKADSIKASEEKPKDDKEDDKEDAKEEDKLKDDKGDDKDDDKEEDKPDDKEGELGEKPKRKRESNQEYYKTVRTGRRDIFYESSMEDGVNEPDENEK